MHDIHDRTGAAPAQRDDHRTATASNPGKSTRIEQLQLHASGLAPEDPTAQVHAAAELGTSGPSQALPHLATIQRLFGRHDVTGTEAYVGGPAEVANKQIGATGYASRNKVAFAGPPDLHTAAHEAAHVVQQRGGVQLKGGVGAVGDRYEQHADAVADRVVRGDSAEDLLSEGHAGGSPAVQLRDAGGGNAPAAQRGAAELLEEAIDVIKTALAMAHGDAPRAGAPATGEAEAGPPTAAAAKPSPEVVAHLQTARGELIKLRGAADDQIRAAVLPILRHIGAPGLGDAPTTPASEAPVQRNTLVLGAPLLGAGPPGWVVYAVLAVGTVGVVGYAMYRANASRAEREQAIADTASEDQQHQHRGRIQVQGGGLEKSFPWARPAPMTKGEAAAGLEALRVTLSRRELQERSEAFTAAKRFIEATLHTCPPQISRTFQNKAVRQRGGDERVDIEIRTGVAFA